MALAFETVGDQIDFSNDLAAAGLVADESEGLDVAYAITRREQRKEHEYAAWAAWAAWRYDQQRVERLERRIAQLEARVSVASLVYA